MHSTLVSGDTTELRCQLAFTERDFDTYKPTRASSKADLVADINGKLVKIQCKAASPYRGKTEVCNICTHYRTLTTTNRTRNKYTKDEVDFFYTNYMGYDLLIPIEDVDGIEKALRFTAPMHKEYSKICPASDYLFDKVIDSIITGTPVQKFSDNYIISTDVNTGEVTEWNTSEFINTYEDKQRNNIKNAIGCGKTAYGKYWTTKAFPELHITNYNVA